MRTASDSIEIGMSVHYPPSNEPRASSGRARPRLILQNRLSGTATDTPGRVYYLPLPMLHLATSIARPNLVSLGTCLGKFSKSGKFKLGVTSLDYLAKYAKYKASGPPHYDLISTTRIAARRRSLCRLMDPMIYRIATM